MLRLWIAVSIVWVAVIGVELSDQFSEIFAIVDPPEGQGAVALPPALHRTNRHCAKSAPSKICSPNAVANDRRRIPMPVLPNALGSIFRVGRSVLLL
jgi:hypothetical protein